MDKKEIMNSMPSSKRGRKKLANSIRSETFSDAYPEEATKKPTSVTEDPDQKVSQENSRQDSKKPPQEPVSEPAAVAAKTTASKKKSGTPRRKSTKAAGVADTPKVYTSFNCLKTTHTRTAVLSALLKKPVYELLDEAMDEYISRLKKSGKLTVDI